MPTWGRSGLGPPHACDTDETASMEEKVERKRQRLAEGDQLAQSLIGMAGLDAVARAMAMGLTLRLSRPLPKQ